jgi:hypothetical protein
MCPLDCNDFVLFDNMEYKKTRFYFFKAILCNFEIKIGKSAWQLSVSKMAESDADFESVEKIAKNSPTNGFLIVFFA